MGSPMSRNRAVKALGVFCSTKSKILLASLCDVYMRMLLYCGWSRYWSYFQTPDVDDGIRSEVDEYISVWIVIELTRIQNAREMT